MSEQEKTELLRCGACGNTEVTIRVPTDPNARGFAFLDVCCTKCPTKTRLRPPAPTFEVDREAHGESPGEFTVF